MRAVVLPCSYYAVLLIPPAAERQCAAGRYRCPLRCFSSCAARAAGCAASLGAGRRAARNAVRYFDCAEAALLIVSLPAIEQRSGQPFVIVLFVLRARMLVC